MKLSEIKIELAKNNDLPSYRKCSTESNIEHCDFAFYK